MPHFLASVWMCIHSSRMGAYYMLSEAVTAAFSEEAKHFTAQTMYPGRRTSTYTQKHALADPTTHEPTDTMHIDKMKGPIYQTTSRGRPEDV